MGKVIRCNNYLIQARERVRKGTCTPLPRARESHPPDIVTSTSPSAMDTSEVSWEPSSMTQEEDAPSLRSTSETPINTRKKLSTSLQLREPTLDSTSSLAEKPPSQPETSSPSVKSLKEPLSATSNPQSVIRAATPDAQELTPPSSVTPKMAPRPESDFPQAAERPSTETAEPPSESLLVEEETKSQSWRPEPSTSNIRDSEKDSPLLLVSEWTPLTILTVVVTTSIWVNPEPSTDTPLQVRRSVSLPPEELVSLEVPRRSKTFPKRRSDRNSYLNHHFVYTYLPSLSFDLVIKTQNKLMKFNEKKIFWVKNWVRMLNCWRSNTTCA